MERVENLVKNGAAIDNKAAYSLSLIKIDAKNGNNLSFVKVDKPQRKPADGVLKGLLKKASRYSHIL